MSRVLVIEGCELERERLARLLGPTLQGQLELVADHDTGLGLLLRGLEQGRPFAVVVHRLAGPAGGESDEPSAPANGWHQELRELWSLDESLQVLLRAEPEQLAEESFELGALAPHGAHLALLELDCGPTVLGQLVGLLLDKHRLTGSVPERADAELTRQLRELVEANRILERQLEQQRATIIEAQHDSESLQESYGNLEKAHAVAQAATRAKSEFLANMSHEIRTPMTAILGYADLLRDPELTRGDHHTYLNVIRRNGDHLLDLINDVLDLSKIEAGRMTIEQVECSPGEILGEIASMLQERARKKSLEFEVYFAGVVPATIVSDPTRVRQILLNLVGNAIKFTMRGSVTVTCRLRDAQDSEQRLLSFTVRDTGIGLGPVEQQQVFTAFSQGDNSTTRRFGGTGLGLAISRRLARMLGGDITVESIVGQGSAFTLTIPTGNLADVELLEQPLARTPEEAEEVEPQREHLTGRILLAEDGRDNQLLVTHYLHKAGAAVEVAADGALALAAARANTPGFDLILMDMQMPKLDGYEVTRTLRAEGWTGPIVALTAHAMPGDREKCLAAGCDEYLTKPIDRQQLIRLCARMIAAPAAPLPARRDEGGAQPTTEETPARKGKRRQRDWRVRGREERPD